MQKNINKFDFFVIVHADRLHEGKHHDYPESELFRKTEVIASILEQRIFNAAREMIEIGRPVYFLGEMPDYLFTLPKILYFHDNDELTEFEASAAKIDADGGRFGLIGGVFSFACIKDFIRTELKDFNIKVEVDPDLTELFFDEYELKPEGELRKILESEKYTQIDRSISKK